MEMPEPSFPWSGPTLPARAKEMGIAGMMREKDGWVAEFSAYAGIRYDMPQPVIEWILGGRIVPGQKDGLSDDGQSVAVTIRL